MKVKDKNHGDSQHRQKQINTSSWSRQETTKAINMDCKQNFKNRICIVFVTLVLLQFVPPSEGFFLPRFMRRQATSPPQQQKLNPAASRGQHGEGIQQQQQSFRAIPSNNNQHRPLPNFKQGDSMNGNSNINNNFQVPDALCLACEKFPWTPVQSSAPSVGHPSVIVIGGGNENNNANDPSKPIAASSEPKPQHYEVQIHKDRDTGVGGSGTTVVINDLGANPPEDGNRKPYVLLPDATQTQNTIVQPTGSSYGGPQSHALSVNYNEPRQPTLLQPVPQNNQQYGQPNHVQSNYDNRAPVAQNQYGPGVQQTPTILQPVPNPNSIHQYGQPQQFKNTFSKIPLMNVGTIIAAQHNAKPHDIQPGKLVYQEHMQIYGAPTQQSPNYGLPPKPQGQYAPQQNFPQSYKLPIINKPSAGSISINQIPLENVPNYVPVKPQGYGNYGAPPQPQGYQAPTGFMQPPGPPPGYNPPRPGYAPAQSGYLPPPPPQQGYRQPRPLPPAPPQPQQQYRHPQPAPPPPPPPQQPYQPQAPRPQANYGNFQPPPPPQQQGYNQFQVQHSGQPTQQHFNQQPQDKPAPPPSVPRPTPPNNLYGTPFGPPMPTPQLEMRPPPEHYFTPQIQMMPPLPPEPSPPAGYQAPDQESDNNYQGIDIRIPTQSVQQPQSEITPISVPNAEYSLQSVTNQVVFREQFDKRPSLFPSPPTKPFGRPSEDSSKAESEFVKNPHLQSLNQGTRVEDKHAPTESAQPSSPSLPASGGGRWEIVPATQYDITHLFNKNRGKSVDQPQQSRKRPFPIPVPVPISEAHVANSQSPVFVVGQHRPSSEQAAQEEQRQQDPNGIRYQPVQLETTIYTTTGPAPSPSSQPQYGGHQPQFDPLPPSVVRALYNSQRTSFLTHQHLTPEQNRDHSSPIFVNSVTVSESPPEETRNSASQVDPNSKVASVQQIIDSSTRYAHSHHNPQGQHSDQDQTVVNCQNSPQWVIPNSGRTPAYVHQPITDSKTQQLEQQPSKPFVYYYPSPMSSVYWVEKPASGASNHQQQQPHHHHQAQQSHGYGQRVPVTTILQHQYASESEANEAAQQVKPSYVKLSTVVSSSSVDENNNVDNNNSIVDSVAYESYYQNQHKQEENKGGNGNENVPSQQVVEDDESDESSSIIQQVSTQAPYDILAFAKEPVYGAQHIDDVADPDGYDQSSTGSVNSEYTSTPEYVNNENDDDEAASKGEVKASVSYKSFSSQLQPRPSTMSPFYFIHNHRHVQSSDKMKSPKYVAGDDNSYRVVYDTKVSAQSNNYEIVGPTTLAECFTTPEPTTVITSTTESPAATDTYAAGTSTIGASDDYTNYDNMISTTFSPYRVNTQNRIRLHASSRFPTGRPSPTTPIPLSETTAITSGHESNPGSASVNVPIYRPAVTVHGESLLASSTERSESYISPDGKDEPPSPPFNRLSSTSRKVPAFTPSKRIPNQTEREPIIVESVPVAQSSDQQIQNASNSGDSASTTTPSSSSNMTTKIVKTVRVRQRMRAGSPFGNSGMFRARLAATGQGNPSRIKVIQRPASQDYVKNFPEYAAPEGETLAEEEQTEVKNALIEIKKVK